MFRLLTLLALLSVTACGLAEDPRDEDNKYIYLTFSDPAFKDYCLREFDTSGDGRISVYEAQRVLKIDCPGLGIESMWEISYFVNMRTLICNDNRIAELDLSKCAALQTVNCIDNQLVSLYINSLRSLTTVDCSNNKLSQLDLQSNVSLRTLRCASNALTTLDVSPCSLVMDEVDARNCPLTVFYKGSSQQIRVLQLDDPNIVQEL